MVTVRTTPTVVPNSATNITWLPPLPEAGNLFSGVKIYWRFHPITNLRRVPE